MITDLSNILYLSAFRATPALILVWFSDPLVDTEAVTLFAVWIHPFDGFVNVTIRLTYCIFTTNYMIAPILVVFNGI